MVFVDFSTQTWEMIQWTGCKEKNTTTRKKNEHRKGKVGHPKAFWHPLSPQTTWCWKGLSWKMEKRWRTHMWIKWPQHWRRPVNCHWKEFCWMFLWSLSWQTRARVIFASGHLPTHWWLRLLKCSVFVRRRKRWTKWRWLCNTTRWFTHRWSHFKAAAKSSAWMLELQWRIPPRGIHRCRYHGGDAHCHVSGYNGCGWSWKHWCCPRVVRCLIPSAFLQGGQVRLHSCCAHHVAHGFWVPVWVTLKINNLNHILSCMIYQTCIFVGVSSPCSKTQLWVWCARSVSLHVHVQYKFIGQNI